MEVEGYKWDRPLERRKGVEDDPFTQFTFPICKDCQSPSKILPLSFSYLRLKRCLPFLLVSERRSCRIVSGEVSSGRPLRLGAVEIGLRPNFSFSSRPTSNLAHPSLPPSLSLLDHLLVSASRASSTRSTWPARVAHERRVLEPSSCSTPSRGTSADPPFPSYSSRRPHSSCHSC